MGACPDTHCNSDRVPFIETLRQLVPELGYRPALKEQKSGALEIDVHVVITLHEQDQPPQNCWRSLLQWNIALVTE